MLKIMWSTPTDKCGVTRTMPIKRANEKRAREKVFSLSALVGRAAILQSFFTALRLHVRITVVFDRVERFFDGVDGDPAEKVEDSYLVVGA